ncbi:helix-turn-helix transcriptional regulator [Micromonospora sp. NPDC023644]|uniref:helix-turn-helix transcriptional regulator n=1 Tax=Micromonospora sp. NPDC023644 TaxID=3154321 RepID=UPI0033DDB3D3
MATTTTPERGNWATYVTRVREHVGMTKSELARRLGVDRGTVIRWESGKSRPEDAVVVTAFAELFDLDVDEALTAAGLRVSATPAARPNRDAPLDPDLKVIMRRLTNPDVSEAEKTTIRATLRYLAQVAEQQERGAAPNQDDRAVN